MYWREIAWLLNCVKSENISTYHSFTDIMTQSSTRASLIEFSVIIEIFYLWSVVLSHAILPNVASMTEKWSFKFYLILIKLKFKKAQVTD